MKGQFYGQISALLTQPNPFKKKRYFENTVHSSVLDGTFKVVQLNHKLLTMKSNFSLILPLLFLLPFSLAAQDCAPEIGTNLGEFRTALVDIFKSSRTFWETDLDDYVWDTHNGLTLDANGYPTSINTAEGRAARTLIWEALEGNYPTGTYTLLYDGVGTIELGMDAVNPVFTDNGNLNNRITFEVNTPTNEGIMVDITASDLTDYVRNIRIIRPDIAGSDYVNTYATEPFTDLFYERHKYFKSVRFMDWMSTNYSRYSTWAERPTWQKSTWAIYEGGFGVPVEVMVHVANRLQADPWFCMPHRADDDYMTQFATYVRDHLDMDLQVSIEYSNEVWNDFFSSYEHLDGQNTYALDRGAANGVTGHFERIGYWLGRRSGEMFDIFTIVFGGDSRLVKIIPIQTGPDLATPITLDYVHNGTPLHQIGDVVAGATYFGGEYDRDALNGMTTTELLDALAMNMYNHDSGPYWTLQTIELLNSDKYQASNLQFVAYEGGQHLANFAGTPEDNATTVLIAANRDARMGDIYTNFYDWWAASGAGTFMTFTSMGEASMFGAWGLLENIEQDTLTAPKWLATTEWIRDNECMTTALANVAIDFQGKQVGDKNNLHWHVQLTEQVVYFNLEKLKKDHWTPLLHRAANTFNRSYQYEDLQPVTGTNYYRLTLLSGEGMTLAQQVISVDFNPKSHLKIVPNLVRDVAYLSTAAANHLTPVTYRIFNHQGQIVEVGTLRLSSNTPLDLSHLPAGMFRLQVVYLTGEREIVSLVKY